MRYWLALWPFSFLLTASPAPVKPAPRLAAASAVVLESGTGKILLEKRPDAVVPIASLTKLMTAMVVLDARLDPHAPLRIENADVDTLRHSRSHLSVGTQLTRDEALLLALLASENRAAHALGRTFPGGMQACVAAMNAKAHALGLGATHFMDTSGLHGGNVSTARELARLVEAAGQYPRIREASTTTSYELRTSRGMFNFPNTNALVRGGSWDIEVSKTGFIDEAGPCLAMKAKVGAKPMVMVFLDAPGRYSRLGDAVRVRQWLGGDPSPKTVAHVREKVRPAKGRRAGRREPVAKALGRRGKAPKGQASVKGRKGKVASGTHKRRKR